MNSMWSPWRLKDNMTWRAFRVMQPECETFRLLPWKWLTGIVRPPELTRHYLGGTRWLQNVKFWKFAAKTDLDIFGSFHFWFKLFFNHHCLASFGSKWFEIGQKFPQHPTFFWLGNYQKFMKMWPLSWDSAELKINCRYGNSANSRTRE